MAPSTRTFHLELPEDLSRLLRTLPALSQAYVVGGSVRDALLQLPVKDIDVEVFGQSYESLADALAPHGRIDAVGRSFGVIKFSPSQGVAYDISLPRRDSKVAPGHKGFIASPDSSLSLKEASARRDFTLNALLYDPRSERILDYHGGLQDLGDRVLRHTSPAFTEDPLRVLRGMQMVSRFELTPHPDTLTLCRSIRDSFAELAVERVWGEWTKWATRSRRPSAGLWFLRETGWLAHFPEIQALDGTPQDPEWHPEGDVFTHTAHCCDALVRLPEWESADETTRIVWMMAVLCHDFAKPQTTRQEFKHGRMCITSPDHEAQGGPLALNFLQRLRVPNVIPERVIPLVVNHLAHLQTTTDRAVRRLAHRLLPETIASLCVVMTADAMGRPPRPALAPESVTRLLQHSEALRLRLDAPRPLLQGRHLVAAGLRPGKTMGRLLAEAFEAQLDGEFMDIEGASAWLASRLSPGSSPTRLGETN